MTKAESKGQINQKGSILLSILLVAVLSLFTLGVSWVVRANNFYYIPNSMTFGLNIPDPILIFVLLVVTGAIYYFDLYKHHMLPSMLMLTGGWGNGLEKLFLGKVTDYIPFINSYINIADIMIWVGLIWLNISLWFFTKPVDPKQKNSVKD